jgi:DNA repair protein RadC
MTDTEFVDYTPKIADLPLTDRPRERLLRYGAAALSNAELLAVVLRVGGVGQNAVRLAEVLLARFGGLPGLSRAGVGELTQVRGMGESKVAQIKAALEIGRRLLVAAPDERPQIRSPGDVANLLMLEMSWLEQEHLRVVLLDTRNRVLGVPNVYIGSLNTSVVRVGELFREAIRHNAAALIVAHNHPSGDPAPSPEDVAVTRQIVRAGRLLDIEVLDHLVIGRGRYISLKERNLGFEAE